MKYVKCNLSLKSGFGFLWLAFRRSRLGWYSTLSIQSPRNLYKSQIPSLLVPSLGRFMNHSSNNWNLNYFTLFKHWELLISWNSVSFTNVLPVAFSSMERWTVVMSSVFLDDWKWLKQNYLCQFFIYLNHWV